jgi:hypothetical protein
MMFKYRSERRLDYQTLTQSGRDHAGLCALLFAPPQESTHALHVCTDTCTHY